ncbi:hypothetical protein D5Q48_03480 [Salmonella enterica subsp. enterica serovar Larochelle]|nr:hypothetical protein [Salmonella enterica subsp. enterica serovar Mikawasima]EBY9724992.1 hypothetical protein [Salmonella enterica subsp. enterica serovar Larochelle]ECB4558138.1 hypothetical protein [Salmonella enterica subsp. enterica serovar Weltevreden]ECB7139978.1 hypothetical protein [Salmonella enterica subsp. enterica serovar Braenderup]ECJ1544860.1 hypothetical protein [Salmonella enterica subsp. enterica serovar Typhimurium]ECJ4589386.1 hypothetical protein [Salmonella enterica s
MVLIDHIASTAYVRILNDPSDIMFSMYDVNTGLKHIILCMLEYMIPTFTEHGTWDVETVSLIVRCYRPRSNSREIHTIASHVHRAICEEMGIPPKGYRYHYNQADRILRFIPRKVTDVYDDGLY